MGCRESEGETLLVAKMCIYGKGGEGNRENHQANDCTVLHVVQLLQYDPQKRLPLDGVFMHPWITENAAPSSLKDSTLHQ